MRVHPEESMLPNVGIFFFQGKSTPCAAFGFCFRLSIVVTIFAAENEHCLKDCQPPRVQSVQYLKKMWFIIFCMTKTRVRQDLINK